MITINRTGWKTDRYVGMSTDEKPTSAKNGEQFCEIDTGDTYFYDEENLQWYKANSGGGGGGGGGGIDPAEKGAANGVCPLNEDTKIDKSYLPDPTITTVTLLTGGWALDSQSGYYIQDITVQGMTASSYPSAKVTYPSGTTIASKEAIDEAANLLVSMTTSANMVSFYAVDALETNVTLTLQED